MPRLVLLLALVCAPAVAFAATVVRAPVAELAAYSDIILHGIVRRVNDELATSVRGPFLTSIDIEVLENIKGHKAPTFELTLQGGRGFGRALRIPGMPTLREGQEVVLLLERTARGFALTGLAQGVFSVDRTRATPMVVRDLGGTHFVDRVGKPATFDGALNAPIGLAALLGELRAAAGGR